MYVCACRSKWHVGNNIFIFYFTCIRNMRCIYHGAQATQIPHRILIFRMNIYFLPWMKLKGKWNCWNMYAVYNPVFVWTRCAFTWHWRRSATTAFHHMQWRNHVRPTTIRMTNKATNATLSNEYYWESIMHTRMDWGVSTPEHLTSVTQKVEQTLRILIVMLCHWLARARVMNHTCKYILLFTVANRSELILFIYKLNTFLPTHRTNWLIPHCHRTNKFLTVNVVRGVTLSHSRFT